MRAAGQGLMACLQARDLYLVARVESGNYQSLNSTNWLIGDFECHTRFKLRGKCCDFFYVLHLYQLATALVHIGDFMVGVLFPTIEYHLLLGLPLDYTASV